MPIPILATKLYIPPTRTGFVPRARLIERLNEGLVKGRKLTLVSAPAGFGKTTLVSEWVAGFGRQREPKVRTAWLSLDEGDSDLARFIVYLVAALQTIQSGIGEGILTALQSPQPLQIETLLTALLNEISAIPDPFLLVLDDYHTVNSQAVELSTEVYQVPTSVDQASTEVDQLSTSIDAALTFLIEHQPPLMHMIIASREDPALPLARLRARGQLTELRAADLRFTPAEAADFLNRMMGLKLSDGDIASLDTRTEGWIAGLQLAALALQGTDAMQGSPDAASFIKSFTGSHRFVLDYLLEEVLQRQPAEIQTFLLRTSILERLCGPLFDAVCFAGPGVLDPSALGQGTAGQDSSGQRTLEYLEHANLFIVPLDNERRWYRYHHLFGDILRQRLGQRLLPAELAELHLRASVWYEQNGNEAEAFQHALSAGDFRRAAGLAESAYQGMDNRFQTAAWLGWIKKLPEDAVRIRPVLLTHMAQSYMDAGEPEASEDCLRAVERCLDGSSGGLIVADEAQLKPLPALIAMTRAYNAQVQGDLSATVKYAELAVQLVPEGDLFRRAQATVMLEVVHWTRGDLEAACSAMEDWMDSMQKVGNVVFIVASAFAMADMLVVLGRLREAIMTYQQALQLAAKHGQDAQQITAHHYLGLALLYHEMGADAAAAEHLQKARELGEQTTLVDWAYRWRIAQAGLKASEGDLETALILLDEAGRAYVKTPIPDTRPIEALKASVYLKQGCLDKAQAWVRTRGLSAEDETSYLNEFEHLVLARVLIAEYQSQRSSASVPQVVGLLERLLRAAEAQRRTGSIIEILVAQALAHQAQGDLPMAFVALARALTLAEPEGYLRLLVDEGDPMRLLLLGFRSQIEKQSSGQSHPLHGYVERLLSGFDRAEGIHPMAHPQKVKRMEPEVQAAKIRLLEPPPLIEAEDRQAKTMLVDPLSERELEVLKLLRSELSGPEIADQLVISPNTFRTHTKNIFSKLGVNNRRAAVRRAEELDLF